jgi:hypothetical protein
MSVTSRMDVADEIGFRTNETIDGRGQASRSEPPATVHIHI